MIDPRAVVDPAATLAAKVRVSPFAVIDAEVEIGEGTWIGPHAVIRGPTKIGRDNRIFQFASIGEEPQDKKYHGEHTYTEIGDRNQIREFCTIHRGTVQDHSITRVGNDNLLMAYTHVAHDSLIGNNTILANGATLGGHVQVGDWAILGGFTLVHQFCRIGAHSICGFGSGIRQDVPPFCTVAGYPAKPHGINVEGLKRRQYPAEEIMAIRRAYKVVYRAGLSLDEAIARVRSMVSECPPLQILADFLAGTERGIVR